jgi:hypothetical protein
MRPLAAVLLLAFAASPAVAADKDEDKAKEAALALLKAVKAKDLDAVMKVVDVPFILEDTKVVAKTDELKAALKPLLEDLKPEKLPDAAGAVLDLPAIRKKLKDREKVLAEVEKVLGKTGYAVVMTRDGKEHGAVLVRIKDGQAKAVGIVD